MQAMILAAGMGSRLGKYTYDQTKCMVRVNGKRLIEHALNALLKVGIKRTIIVVGYKGDKVKSFLGSNYYGMEIIYVDNDIYDQTNNIYSLWLAKNYLVEDDTLLLESDVIFEEKILEDIINKPNPNLVVVAPFESWMDGTVTLLDEADNILNFLPKKSFKWDSIEHYYKTVNIYKFSREFSRNTYEPFLEAYINVVGKNEYYEQVLRVITYLDNINLKAHRLEQEKWYEIDDIQDLDIAGVLFSEENNTLELYQKRYGGYWRFPRLKDFCYLVNPFFPNRSIVDELKSNFTELVSQYPSGLNIQNLLAAKLFNCENEEILVGNGAAELIKALFDNVEGDIGVIYPTFNEYPERAGSIRVKAFYPSNNDFNYTIDEIKEFSKQVEHLVLINPDNPSGHFFNKEEITDLLKFLYENNVGLILDESFVDFAEENYSLIDSDILQTYKNLIVIRSISKSYGVPGLRLGILASGNRELISKLAQQLPIWNINSFGEYFMQIVGKYKSIYLSACRLLAEERERFYLELLTIDYLRVIPSKANYFLCEVINKYTATELTKQLLQRYNILIKDCTDKPGFENQSYIRIAVRDYADNNFLVNKLKEL